MNYPQRLSSAITWLRFPLIFFIVMLHCYSVVRLEGSHSTYFSAVYPFALWIGETGVPGFFFISGYLFFLSKKTYSQKLQTRFHTLLIPYLLWNAIILTLYLIAYAAGYPQDINHKNIADFSFFDYVRLFWDRGTYDHGNFVPLLCPFWYIRNLLIMSLLSPVFYYLIKYVREFFLILITAWWLMTFDNAFIPQTILFFCMGAYFAIHNTNPLELACQHRYLVLTLFIILAIGDIVTHTIFSTPVNLQIHRMALIINVITLLLLADFCTSRGISSSTLPNAAFIVFAIHYPIVVVLRKICAAKFASASDGTHILLYFLCIIITVICCLLFYQLLDRFFPKTKNILSGNR